MQKKNICWHLIWFFGKILFVTNLKYLNELNLTWLGIVHKLHASTHIISICLCFRLPGLNRQIIFYIIITVTHFEKIINLVMKQEILIINKIFPSYPNQPKLTTVTFSTSPNNFRMSFIILLNWIFFLTSVILWYVKCNGES